MLHWNIVIKNIGKRKLEILMLKVKKVNIRIRHGMTAYYCPPVRY